MSDIVKNRDETERVAVLYVRDFPPELHTELRVESALTNDSMREIVIAAVRAEIERRKAERES